MSQRRVGWLILAAGLAFPAGALADRAPEPRSTATHVVVGRVEDVYAQVGAKGANQGYVIEIAVEKVERGGGLTAGGTFYASVYMPNPRAPDTKKMTARERKAYLFTIDGGYNAVPKRGDRVRVFVIHSGGKYRGVFPDWMDVLKGK
jgi:hypothetical protein